jgi:hypothetical protein
MHFFYSIYFKKKIYRNIILYFIYNLHIFIKRHITYQDFLIMLLQVLQM